MRESLTSWREVIVNIAEERATEESRELWGQPPGEVPRFNYRWEHIRAVARLAESLARRTNADLEVVQAAAWLHDIVKGEIAEGEDGHGKEGAAEARRILDETDFPPHKIDAVGHAIQQHVGLFLDRPLQPLEAAVLWDADKLSKLGALSLVHFLAANPARDPDMTSEALLERGREWLYLAERIADSMNTEPAREMARERLEFLRKFYAQLQRELEIGKS